RIRVEGAGHAGQPGGPAGDLYVQVVVADDERFDRQGQDLVSVAEVPATRAMLGGTVKVATLDGEQDVEVPAGSQPGEQVILRGLGRPAPRGRRGGGQRVVLGVFVPGKLDTEQRELARQLDEALGPEGGRRAGGSRC